MEVNDETLSFMETEVNDAVGRLFPDHKKNFHVQPVYQSDRIIFKTHYLH